MPVHPRGEGELPGHAAVQGHEDTRSTYCAWTAGRQAREVRRQADRALAHEITVIHLASRKNYGVPRVTAALRRQGRGVNHKRVARIMREHRIAGNSRRNGRRSLTKAETKAAPSPDLTGRDFTAARPGTKIVGDITYIPTAEGWLYLASWLDLATREVIGYSMADHHRAELVVDALDMAAAPGRLEPVCVIHSDHGSEYLLPTPPANSPVGVPAEHGKNRELFRLSVSWHRINAAAESFWAVLKEEIGTRFLARPGNNPRRHLRLRRDPLQQTPPAQAHPLGLRHTPRDTPAPPRSGFRGVTTPCPGSRGNFTANRNPGMAEFVHGPDGEDMYKGFSTRPVLTL